MASSTTMAIASTRAQSVNRFTLNPIRYRTKNVPIKATGIAIAGISVERKSCRKMNTTRNTRINASISVLSTSLMEANRKSFVSIMIS